MFGKSIFRIKYVSLLLFLIPFIGILASIFTHNFLTNYKFIYDVDYSSHLEDKPGNIFQLHCNETNNYCLDKEIVKIFYNQTSKLNECFLYKVEQVTYIQSSENMTAGLPFEYDKSGKLEIINNIKNKNFIIESKVTKNLNQFCIKNYEKIYKIYNFFPIIFNFKAKISKDIRLATGESINPFFYGETSISNLVKRFPINYVFKPAMFATVLLIIFYWIYYNRIFKLLDNNFNFFYIFGILSGFFLFFHILFLGSIISTETSVCLALTKTPPSLEIIGNTCNELFQPLRRVIIILFILFEVLAQVFLAKKLFLYKNILKQYCKFSIIYLKILFVSIVVFVTILIILILSFYNFPSKIDYILEWNYFLFLLFFYLLSFLMWKKQ